MNLDKSQEGVRRSLIAERDLKAHQSYSFYYPYPEDPFMPFRPYYPWYDLEGKSDDIPERDDDCLELELYQPNGKFEPKHRIFYRSLLKEYFPKSLGNRINTSDKWVILSKSKYDEFTDVVSRFRLEEYSDFLLECVCLAQKTLKDDVLFWETRESQKLKKTAIDQTERLAIVVRKFEDLKSYDKVGKKAPAESLSISFAFADENLKIDHPWLLSLIADGIKMQLSKWSDNSWESGAKNFASSFNDYPAKNDFKFKLARSFYDFLLSLNQFDLSHGTTPNNLMLCIVRLLEFSLVTVSATDENDSDKEKIVRNWIRRGY